MSAELHSPLELNPRLLALIPVITMGTTDNARIGSFWCRKNIAIGTGNTDVAHGLGRAPSGYIVTRNYTGGTLQDGDTTRWSNLLVGTGAGNISLKASVAGTFDLLIF